MPRIRTIKPETFMSDDVNALSVAARWTFVGLWCFVDDSGRGRADPRLIKAAVWPIDDAMSVRAIAEHLDEMERRAMICRYEVDGVRYLHVVNFDAHQRINRPTASKLPECSRTPHGGLSEESQRAPKGIESAVSAGRAPFTEPSVSAHGAVTEASPPEQGTGNREVEREQGSGKGTGNSAARGVSETTTRDDETFERLWSVYPRKVGRADARRAWTKAAKRADLDTILAAAARYRDQPGREEKFTAHLATWLHGERWNDELAARTTGSNGSNGHHAYRDGNHTRDEYLGDL